MRDIFKEWQRRQRGVGKGLAREVSDQGTSQDQENQGGKCTVGLSLPQPLSTSRPSWVALVYSPMTKSVRRFSLGIKTFHFIMKSKQELGYYYNPFVPALLHYIAEEIQDYFKHCLLTFFNCEISAFAQELKKKYDDHKGNQEVGAGRRMNAVCLFPRIVLCLTVCLISTSISV